MKRSKLANRLVGIQRRSGFQNFHQTSPSILNVPGQITVVEVVETGNFEILIVKMTIVPAFWNFNFGNR